MRTVPLASPLVGNLAALGRMLVFEGGDLRIPCPDGSTTFLPLMPAAMHSGVPSVGRGTWRWPGSSCPGRRWWWPWSVFGDSLRMTSGWQRPANHVVSAEFGLRPSMALAVYEGALPRVFGLGVQVGPNPALAPCGRHGCPGHVSTARCPPGSAACLGKPLEPHGTAGGRKAGEHQRHRWRPAGLPSRRRRWPSDHRPLAGCDHGNQPVQLAGCLGRPRIPLPWETVAAAWD